METEGRTAGHPRWALALVALGGVLTLVAIFSIWINRQALNTDNWVRTSDRLLADEAVRDRLSEYLAEQVFAEVDLGAQLRAAVPPRLAPLAGAAAGGLEQVAPQAAARILAGPAFQAVWEAANRHAHETLLEILDGGGRTLSTGGGEVVLRLGPTVDRLGERFGIEGASARIPAGAGNIAILESDQLSVAQDVARAVRRLPIVLTALLVACFAGAILLAGAHRRRALRSVGFAFLAAGLTALALRSFAGSYVVGSLSRTATAEPAVEAVWEIATSLLVSVATGALAFGALVVAAAWAAGETRAALSLRDFARPYARRGAAGIYGAALLLFLALVAWAPVPAFHRPLGVLVFALLFAVGTELWRRQVLAEPDAPQARRPISSPPSGDATAQPPT